MKRKILLLPGAWNSPAARFRIWQFVKSFRANGHEVTVRVPFPDRTNETGKPSFINWKQTPARLLQGMRIISAMWMLRDIKKFDIVIANRDITPDLWTAFLEKWIVKNKVKLIFDFDDAIYLGGRDDKLKMVLPICSHISPGNPTLAKYALQFNANVTIVPTVVDTSYYQPAASRKSGPIRIGWSGSASTNVHCLPILEKPIKTLAKKFEFEFVVISNEDPHLKWEGVSCTFLRWNAAQEVEQLQMLDIGLMPLQDNEFERGKCGLKAIQYMGVGVPAVVSPVGVNTIIITHGVDGYHATSDTDWVDILSTLLQDESLRERIGMEGRKRAEEAYSIAYACRLWETIFNKIMEVKPSGV